MKKQKDPKRVAAGKRSRTKGKGGELEAVHWLRSLGFSDARRTAQHRSGGIVGDIECPDTLPRVHIEVKRFGKYGDVALTSQVIKACGQASRDCPVGKHWCVIWRNDGNTQWRVTYADPKKTTVSTDKACAKLLNELNNKPNTRGW